MALPDLDWEVGVFRALRALWRWASPAGASWDASRVAHLEDHQVRLQALARLVSGVPVRVLPARGAGGVRGLDLLIPSWLDLAPDPEANAGLLLLRSVLAATVAAAGVPVPRDATERVRAELAATGGALATLRIELARFGPAWDEAAAVVLATRPDPGTLRGAAAVEEQARQELLRGNRPWEDEALWAAHRSCRTPGSAAPPLPLWGPLLDADAEDARTGDPSGDGGAPTSDATEMEAPPVDEIRRVLLDEERGEQKVLMHTFEKVETAETFDGNPQRADGSDELADHLEALEELDLREVIRGGDAPESIYRADIGVGANIPDVADVRPDEKGVPFDEWDQRARAYRPGWCTVYPTAIGIGRPAWVQEALGRNRLLVEDLYDRLLAHRMRRAWTRRQRDGEEPDIDAVIDALATVRSGHTGPDRLYLRRLPRQRDIATTVLIDVSLSSDSWIDDRRVLDVAREAVLVLGEVADRLQDRFQVLAYASSTRHRCRVWCVKDWAEPWGPTRARLGVLEPQGYTRIGPAVRFATRELIRSQASARCLLLVTDGKPTDLDRYEGRHGLEDVKMAVREAIRDGVTPHALAIDTVARGVLPVMFGASGFSVVPTPDRLPDVLGTVYGRLTTR